MDYKELIERLRRRESDMLINHPMTAQACRDAATAITDLLARAEAAEARVKNLSEALERERRRAEKAKMERDAYKIFFDDVSSKPDCNTCYLKQCEYRPEIGQTTRFNCPLWRGQKEE